MHTTYFACQYAEERAESRIEDGCMGFTGNDPGEETTNEEDVNAR